MKKQLLALAFGLAALAGTQTSYSQCTPNAAFTSPHIASDNADNDLVLDTGYVGVPYNAVILVNIPTVWMSVTVTNVDYDATNSVYPAGLSGTPNSASWPGGTQGCVAISGTPTTAGTSQVTLAYNGCSTYGCAPQINDSISITINSGTGISELDGKKFSMAQNSPNPSRGFAEISYSMPSSQEITFKVFNMLGEAVYARNIAAKAGVNKIFFSSADLAPGIYMYTLNNGQTTLTKRMVVASR